MVGDAEGVEACCTVEIDQFAKRELPVAPRRVSVKLAEEEGRIRTHLAVSVPGVSSEKSVVLLIVTSAKPGCTGSAACHAITLLAIAGGSRPATSQPATAAQSGTPTTASAR